MSISFISCVSIMGSSGFALTKPHSNLFMKSTVVRNVHSTFILNWGTNFMNFLASPLTGRKQQENVTIEPYNIWQNVQSIIYFLIIPNRLKRDSTKLNSADMLALLSFLEAKQHNRYDNGNDDINSLEYPKSFYGPYGNFDDGDNDDEVANTGEWLNEWIEPSVRYYGGNSRGRFDENPRKRLTSTGDFVYFFSSSLGPFSLQLICYFPSASRNIDFFSSSLLQMEIMELIFFLCYISTQYSQWNVSWLQKRNVQVNIMLLMKLLRLTMPRMLKIKFRCLALTLIHDGRVHKLFKWNPNNRITQYWRQQGIFSGLYEIKQLKPIQNTLI